MDITPLIPEGRQIVQSYNKGVFKISGVNYGGAVIVTPMGTFPWSAPSKAEELKDSDFALLSDNAENLDVVLLGTGTKGMFLPKPLRTALKEKGLKVELMDTGAACRTYNVLMAEGRRVAAALLPIE